MAFALVTNVAFSSPGFSGGGTSSAVNCTGANLLAAVVGSVPSEGTAFSDSSSNTWSAGTAIQSGSSYGTLQGKIYYCASPTVGSSQTFTVGNGYSSLAMQAWSGAHSSPFDVENGAAGTQAGSITPSQNGSLIVSGGAASHCDSWAVNTGYTITDSVSTHGAGQDCSMAYLVQGTAAALNPTWTMSGSGFSGPIIVTMAFKPAAGGGGGHVFMQWLPQF